MPSDCVLIGGVFDPLHAGHLDYVKAAGRIARQQGHGVVVCALSDDPAKHQPVVPQVDRMRLLQALGAGVVVPYAHNDLVAMMEHWRPKAYIKGKDWEGRLPVEQVEACQRLGIEIIYTDTVTQSSSKLLADYTRRTNAAKLHQFERFVQEQKPADKPWEPVTDYSFEARKEIEGPHAQIIKETFQPRMALDFGCGFGHLVRLLRSLNVKAFGYEPHLLMHPDAFPNLYGGYLANDFDLVICREVLEHVPVARLAQIVRQLVGVSTKYVYITTRFSQGPHLLDVDGQDNLDPTHISMLNQDFLRALFTLEGCVRRPDLERRLDWRNCGRVLVYEVPA